jgi:hypothetical protein
LGYRQVWWHGKHVWAHRVAFELMGVPVPDQVDHINGDKADNRWCNLRAATSSQNARNRRVANRTGFKGVTPWQGRYRAQINRKHIGMFDTAEEAGRAYDVEARKQHGEFYRGNSL